MRPTLTRVCQIATDVRRGDRNFRKRPSTKTKHDVQHHVSTQELSQTCETNADTSFLTFNRCSTQTSDNVVATRQKTTRRSISILDAREPRADPALTKGFRHLNDTCHARPETAQNRAKGLNRNRADRRTGVRNTRTQRNTHGARAQNTGKNPPPPKDTLLLHLHCVFLPCVVSCLLLFVGCCCLLFVLEFNC